MKSFKELMEKAGDTAVFTFGRFNPPTTGHEKLVEAVAKQHKKNAGSKMYVYASHSNDPKKNPLPYAKKIAYMRKMFKKYAKNIVTGKPRTAIEVAVELYDKGHKAIVMVVGSDRVQEFDKLLNEYNGVEGKRHGYYGFDNIEVISAGERDPDAEGVEGMSASKMRVAAADGDFQSFEMGLPSSFAQRKELYRDVRKGMGMREERDMGDMTDMEYLRDLYLTGKIWNAGDLIEANGVKGHIVRKGTNYVSFVDDDGKVHKCWIHEIQLNEAKSPYQKMRDALPKKGQKAWDKSAKRGAGGKWVVMRKSGLSSIMRAQVGSLDYKKLKKQGWSEELDERNYRKEYDNYQGRPEQIARRSSRNKARRVMGDKAKIGMDIGHKDNDPMNNDPSNLRNEVPSDNRREPRLREQEKQMDKDGYKKPKFTDLTKREKKKKIPEPGPTQYEDKGLTRAKQLKTTGVPKKAASQGLPKVKKIGGSKKLTTVSTVKPVKTTTAKKQKFSKPVTTGKRKYTKRLSNEVEVDEMKSANYALEVKGKFVAVGSKSDMNKLAKRKGGTVYMSPGAKVGDSAGKAEEVNEMTSPLPWLNKAVAKIHQMTHPKGWDNMIKQYVVGMKDKDNRAHPSKWAAELARQYKGVEPRDFARYINKLVDKGKLPQDLKTEYTPEHMSFKQFVEVLNKNADQGEYIDDFKDSDAPQFKGKSKKKRIAMAVAAYNDKKRGK